MWQLLTATLRLLWAIAMWLPAFAWALLRVLLRVMWNLAEPPSGPGVRVEFESDRSGQEQASSSRVVNPSAGAGSSRGSKKARRKKKGMR
jgi:hypothetical protein